MKIMYSSYIPLLVLVILAFLFYVIKYEKEYFGWVKKYFFMERSWWSRLSSLLYLLSMILFLISLLDFRGPEQKLEADIPDQRTIIIIDSSASMLAEDVRPNRFQKSLLLARHFVKKAAGHQIAIVLFSDTQKRLVPFTDDIDLLDARVAGLSKIRIENGGSNIKQAIAESLQYFKAQDSNVENISGNILIFTDSESNEESFNFKIPDSVNIAMIGVGTARGAPIPIRSKDGVFRGYKRFNNEKVISKLDENFLKSFSKVADNYKYWISTSFSIPTEKILDFFRNQHKRKLSKGLVRSRPVYSKYVLLPAILSMIAALILQLKPTLVIQQFIFIILLLANPMNVSLAQEKEPKPLDKETLKLLDILSQGTLDVKNRLKIAEGMLRANEFEKAKTLYEENLKLEGGKNFKAHVNYGTLLLAIGDILGGANIYQKIHSNKLVDDQIKEVARKNLLLALNQQKQQQKDKKNKNKDQKQDQNQSQGKGEKSEQSDQNKQNQQGQENNQNQEQKKDGKEEDQKEKNKNKEKKEKGKKNNSKESQDGKKKEEKKKSIKEREEEIKRKRKMVKIPAMLKQIMSDDSQLQKKYIDTSTKKKNQRDKRKDW